MPDCGTPDVNFIFSVRIGRITGRQAGVTRVLVFWGELGAPGRVHPTRPRSPSAIETFRRGPRGRQSRGVEFFTLINYLWTIKWGRCFSISGPRGDGGAFSRCMRFSLFSQDGFTAR